MHDPLNLSRLLAILNQIEASPLPRIIFPLNPRMAMKLGDLFDFSFKLYDRFNHDRVISLAAGVTFYVLLGMFPAITAFVALYGVFAAPDTVTSHISLVEGMVPPDVFGIIKNQVSRAAEGGTTQLTVTSLTAILLALWSANSGTKAIIDALNIIYDVEERRSFLEHTVVSLSLSLGAIAVLLLVTASVVIIPLLLSAFGVGFLGRLEILRWPLAAAVVVVALATLYRFGPNRAHARWRLLTIGTATAASGWLAASLLLSWYFSNFANYNAVYGSLGAVMGLMVWIWVSVIVILLGAEIDTTLAKDHSATREIRTDD